jgi:hypothetical protein
MYGGNVKVMVIWEIYKLFASVYFVSECQVTQPLTVVVGHIVTKGNAF